MADNWVVRVDTSLDCNSEESQTFRALDVLFISAYLSIPLLWFVLLCRRRTDLNPGVNDLRLKDFIRDRNETLGPMRFLFDVYKPQYFFWEVVEMYDARSSD